jgi:hypothetical protein
MPVASQAGNQVTWNLFVFVAHELLRAVVETRLDSIFSQGWLLIADC